MIGNGNSSVHLSVNINVHTYGHHVQKLECSNDAVKCYRGGLEKLAKENSIFRGRNALISNKIHQVGKGMKCAIAKYSTTKNVTALHHDLCNCP